MRALITEELSYIKKLIKVEIKTSFKSCFNCKIREMYMEWY